MAGPPLSALFSGGRASTRQWPILSFQNGRLSCFLTWRLGMLPRFPPPGTPGSLGSQSSVLPHLRPHPQPHPTSPVLSHHGDRISKWEGLESPHILPPPTRVPLHPTFCGFWIHMWRRQGSRCGGGGRGHCSAPLLTVRQAPQHRRPQAGFRVSRGQFSSLMATPSGFPSPAVYMQGGHTWMPASLTSCRLSLPMRRQTNT